jgi:nucleoside-diphosphate-sugar epimerase
MTTAFVTGGSGYLGKSLLAGLVTAGYGVRAMARSSKAAEIVSAAGATPVRCDLDSAESLAGAMDGCELVVHAAGRLHGGGGHSAYTRDNVDGTRHALAAARRAGVRRLVYVGAAGSLMGGRPIIDADEGWPLRRPGYSPYFRSKAIADTEVRAANAPGFATCVVRPGLIWGGDGDPLLEAIAGATRAGKMMLVDGGRHRIVTSHIDNTVRGILLALEKGRPGEAYFVFDDGDIETRQFFAELLATRGLPPPDKAIPFRVAWIIASILDAAWAVLRRPGSPPVNREMVRLNGGPFLVSDRKARVELGYVPVISRADAIARLASRFDEANRTMSIVS